MSANFVCIKLCDAQLSIRTLAFNSDTLPENVICRWSPSFVRAPHRNQGAGGSCQTSIANGSAPISTLHSDPESAL